MVMQVIEAIERALNPALAAIAAARNVPRQLAAFSRDYQPSLDLIRKKERFSDQIRRAKDVDERTKDISREITDAGVSFPRPRGLI
jgi:hypothetical protein